MLARTRAALASALLLLPALVGCASSSKPVITTIRTDPPEAMVSINKQEIGKSPVNHEFNFKDSPSQIVQASMPGYNPAELIVTERTPGVGSTIQVSLVADESFSATAESKATNRWLQIQIDPSLSGDQWWTTLVSIVTSRYSSMEVMEQRSGYIKSAPIERTFRNSRRGEFTVRTQFFGTIDSQQPLRYRVKIESSVIDRMGQPQPYERVFKEDAELVQELQARLGIK